MEDWNGPSWNPLQPRANISGNPRTKSTKRAPGTEWNQAREVATLAVHYLIHRHLFKLTGFGLGVQRLLPWALLGHEVIRVVRQDVLAKPELLPANGVQLVHTLHVP